MSKKKFDLKRYIREAKKMDHSKQRLEYKKLADEIYYLNNALTHGLKKKSRIQASLNIAISKASILKEFLHGY